MEIRSYRTYVKCSLFKSTFQKCLPLLPIRVLRGHVCQPHIEEGGEDKGEEGDCGPAHQVQDRSKVGKGLRDEEKAED